jgi:hypothetical protein
MQEKWKYLLILLRQLCLFGCLLCLFQTFVVICSAALLTFIIENINMIKL